VENSYTVLIKAQTVLNQCVYTFIKISVPIAVTGLCWQQSCLDFFFKIAEVNFLITSLSLFIAL